MVKYPGLEDKRILVVEDVELNQYLARHIMESWGCVVEIVENGSIAVDKVKSFDYDLVLMDIQMPVMDGMQATRLIREMKDEDKSRIPIVALTANALKTECENYLRLGMNDCLAKPFEEPALFNTVSKNIRKSSITSMPASVETEVVMTAKSTEPRLYDLAMVEEISGGDQAFVKKMMLLFLETVPGTLSDLKSSCNAGDWKMLSKHAHKLKSTIDSMGIVQLKEIIREIEIGAKKEVGVERFPTLVQTVLKVMEKVIAEVKKEVA